MSNAERRATLEGYWPWLAFFLIVAGTRFLLIAHYGTETPMEDEWHFIGHQFFEPYLAGQLRLADLFALANEHRIVTTRLYELLTLKLDGGVWSPVQQMIGNALIQAAAVTGLTRLLLRSCPAADRQVYFLFSLVLWGLPLAVENVLVGYQTQFYLLILFSYVFLWALVSARLFSRLWWVGMACGVLGLFTMAAGALTLFCGALFLGLRVARLGGCRSDGVLMLVLLGVVAVAMANTPSGHAPWINPVREVAWAFLQVCAWPAYTGTAVAWQGFIALAIILYGPVAYFFWVQLRRPPAATDESWFALAMALWVLAQLFAISYERTHSLLVTRYNDVYVIGLLLAFLFALRREGGLAERRAAKPEAERAPPPYMTFSQLWVLVVLVSTIHYCTFLVHELDKKMVWAPLPEQNVRGYLQTRDYAWLADKSFPDIPYYDQPALKSMLDNPDIDALLPPNLVPANAERQPMPLRELTAHLGAIGMALLLAGVLCLGVYGWRRPKDSTG